VEDADSTFGVYESAAGGHSFGFGLSYDSVYCVDLAVDVTFANIVEVDEGEFSNG
tara:strand:+ start:369 stop:533 length:165 start_codon:yes stop_codon:yes gene_type:complete